MNFARVEDPEDFVDVCDQVAEREIRYAEGQLGTDVDNLENLIRQLNEKGIELTTAIQETKLGPMVFIKDPDGVNIALIEHRK